MKILTKSRYLFSIFYRQETKLIEMKLKVKKNGWLIIMMSRLIFVSDRISITIRWVGPYHWVCPVCPISVHGHRGHQ